MTLMRRLASYTRRGHRVTLVNPDPYHYYSGMGPGMLGGRYRPDEVRFHVARMVAERGGSFLRDRVVRIDAAQRRLGLASGATLDYDIASCNVGSGIALGDSFQPGEQVVPVKPVVNLAIAHHRLNGLPAGRAVRLVVVGGGPAGVEVAGNLRRLLEATGRRGEVVLVAGSRLLPDFPASAAQLVRDDFRTRGIEILEGVRATSAVDGRVGLANGGELLADLAFLALGVRPPRLFAASGLPVGPDGGLLVNRFLQGVEHPELFGGGDCIAFMHQPLDKVGVYAVRQNPVLYHNLLAALEDRPLRPFVPRPHYLLILNLGDERGVLHRQGRVFDGRWSFWLKNWLDRRFMQTYQLSGEQTQGIPWAEEEFSHEL